MVSVTDFARLFFVAITLFVAGRYFKDYTLGIVGGLFLFLMGVYLLITPLSGVDGWFNDVVGVVLFGVGGYIWIAGGVEVLRDGGYL